MTNRSISTNPLSTIYHPIIPCNKIKKKIKYRIVKILLFKTFLIEKKIKGN